MARTVGKRRKRPSSGSENAKHVDLTDHNQQQNDGQRASKVQRTTSSDVTSSQPLSQTLDLTQDEEDDASNEIVSSSSAGHEQHYGTELTKVVGIRYYDGTASIGECVILEREPHNQYDSNAIRALNVRGQQIGHIPRRLAAKIAPYMDDEDLTLEGVLDGRPTEFDIPLQLQLFGPADEESRAELAARMRRDRLALGELRKHEATERKRRTAALKEATAAAKKAKKGSQAQWANGTGPGGGKKKPEEDTDDLVGEGEVINPREMSRIAMKFGKKEDELASMPQAEQPDRLKIKLLPYQLQGLAWMLDQENPALPAKGSKDIVQLWKRDGELYKNLATNFATKTQPTLARGGILADDMGLGKTVQVISLILADLKKNKGASGPTLIVAPVSVMSNWTTQIERHVSPKSPLKVHVHHGTKRKAFKAKDLQKFDVVVTPYGTLSADHAVKKNSTALFSVKWRRVVLDEAHNIRNPSTKSALAACALQAESNWALTGTPIINNLKDLYSLTKFLGISGGLDRLELFNRLLIRPLKYGMPDAEALLQALMATFCLRRTKGMSFVNLSLPELTERLHKIKFAKHEQEKYNALQDEAKGVLQLYRFASDRGDSREAQKTYHHLLEVLLRLRQVCNHWKLCGERITSLMEMLKERQAVDLTPENRRKLQALVSLSIQSQDECAVCLETLHDPVITPCGHVFGSDCILRVIELQHKCPNCRNPLPDQDSLVRPAVDFGDDSEEASDDAAEDGELSSKLKALLSLVTRVHKEQPGNKLVIFSQWRSFLDLIQPQLEEKGYGIARIDGKMPAAKRDQSLRAFDDDGKTTVMLASLMAGAVGLNLMVANTVIMCDSWWAPAIEDQAFDRVHRLGQTKPVTIHRLVMEGTVEQRTLEVQKEKRELMALALREGVRDRTKRDGANTTVQNIEKVLEA